MTLHYKILYNLLIISFLISLTACHKKERDDKTEQRLFMKTIVVDGLTRRYAIYIPKNLNTKNPLIFELHGGGIYNHDIEMTTEVWQFFKSKRLN